MSWITSFTGRKINFNELSHADICIEDIATGLSNICRFNGQCGKFYSVAEHCVLGAEHLKYTLKNHAAAKAFLLHDASEAYLGDVSSPLKNIIESIYLPLENQLTNRINQVFNIDNNYASLVKEIDMRMCITERDAMLDRNVRWSDKYESLERLPIIVKNWEPRYAKAYFLDLFDLLFSKEL